MIGIGVPSFLKWLIPLVTILHSLNSASASCDFSFVDGKKIYNYTLTSPVNNFPHGVRSEDGYYKVAANETILWFQLCDGMIFNHNPPTCADCWDCGGPMRCGMDCTALVANDIGDKRNPRSGVIVKMSSNDPKLNCSLSVSVLCNSNGIQGPYTLERLGKCNYVSTLFGDSLFMNFLLITPSGSKYKTNFSNLERLRLVVKLGLIFRTGGSI